MKKPTFLFLFIAANVGFVLLHLHKQSQFIQLSYTKQKIEMQATSLAKQKQELTHQLYMLYDRARILTYAKKELNMTQARVGQFKKVGALACLVDTSIQSSLNAPSDTQDGRLLLSEVEGSAPTAMVTLQSIDIPETIEIETALPEEERGLHDPCL